MHLRQHIIPEVLINAGDSTIIVGNVSVGSKFPLSTAPRLLGSGAHLQCKFATTIAIHKLHDFDK
jgi:hypothetical protein